MGQQLRNELANCQGSKSNISPVEPRTSNGTSNGIKHKPNEQNLPVQPRNNGTTTDPNEPNLPVQPRTEVRTNENPTNEDPTTDHPHSPSSNRENPSNKKVNMEKLNELHQSLV